MKTDTQTIAIAGAGVTGACAAYTLMRAGFTVHLYDPAGLQPRNASALAGGMLAPYAEVEHVPLPWIEAGLAGITFWRDLAAENKGRVPFGFTGGGSLLIAHGADLYMMARFKAHLPPGSYETLDAQAIEAHEPDLGTRFASGLFLPDEAHLIPKEALRALMDTLLASETVHFYEQAADVKALAKDHDYVIDARGMGAQEDEPDLRGVKGELVIVRNPEFTLSRAVRLMHPRYPLYIVPRPDHIFMIGATNIEAAADERVSVRSVMELLSAAYSLHPGFGEAHVLDMAAGIRPAYPDNLPRIRVKENIIRCNGLFRHGYLLAPAAAQCITALIEQADHPFLPLFKGEINHGYS